ncbi:MAG: PAS domain S-box protein, partial [Rhodoferax sp.]|nr:PAS domain S-box protein [Pseudorhodobacter sp.]
MAKSTPRLAAFARALQPAIMVFAAAAVAVVLVLGVRLRGELQAFQEEPVDNIHWNVTQLELDAVRFEAETELAQVEPNLPLTELRKRFDLFYSRAQSAIKGKMFDQLGLQDVVTPMNTRLEDFLTDITPIIDSNDTDLRASLPTIAQKATALREDLRDMSVKIVDKYAALADLRRAAFTALVRQVAWAAGIVLIALILMNALVLWLNRLSEARAAETARLSSRLAATVGTSLDAIIVAGMDGRIIAFNEAATQQFGYSREEALGANLSDLIIPPSARGSHEAGMARMKRYGSFRVVNSGRFEMTAMRKGDEEFPIELAIASHNTDDGLIF